MRLSGQKRIWLIPVVVAAVVMATGWWCNTEVRRAIEDQLENELESLINADVTALNIWIDNQLRFVSTLASEDKVKTLALNVVNRAVNDGNEGADLRTYDEVRALRKYVDPRLRQMRLGFVVIDPDGVIIAAPFDGILGDQLHDEALATYQKIFEEDVPILLTPYQPPRRGGGQGPPRGRENGEFERIPRGMERSGRDGGRGAFGGKGNGEESAQGREGEEGEARRRGPGRGPNGQRGAGGPGGRRGGPNRTIMAVAAPLHSPAGEVIAAIGLMIRPELEFTKILSVASSGDSGETFAFDSNGIMLSQSRFEDSLTELGLLDQKQGGGPKVSSALNLELRDPGGNLVEGFEPSADSEEWPLTHLVKSAVVGGGKGVDVSGFRDYRGVPVVGAFQWLPDYEFGVATKLDAAEAFQPLRVLRLVFLILILLSVLSGVGLFLYSYFNALLRRQMEDVALEAKELGQYTLEKKIGEGGMGSVYRARHALLRRDTAVKLLLPEKADENSILRFEREVQMTCRLAHPNTIQIFDYGHTPEGIFYYAMEYLDGINLRDLIKREGKLPAGRVIHILRQICASLSEAHDAGLVHRDIKPANIILSDRGGVPDMVKVLDFGLVKSYRDNDQSSADATQTLSITGTPQFIAPEAVARPDKVDQRSDLYAVGALAYYLLTGDHVFTGDSAFEVMQHHVSTRPEPLHERNVDLLDSDLESLVMRCLEKEASQRPQSAREIVRILLSCHSCGTWSAETQEEWWVTFREQEGRFDAEDGPKSSTILEPTLQINLDNRTRVGS
ncbi:serine/threonine protein kinase [bacterium]|jgi:eukaryotic-like serine/threonine-protein kinase|nr:serine/threonine protein kinase [bacterium]